MRPTTMHKPGPLTKTHLIELIIPDGNKIREIRIAKGIPMKDLAKQIGISSQALFMLETRPNRSCKLQTMEALERVLV